VKAKENPQGFGFGYLHVSLDTLTQIRDSQFTAQNATFSIFCGDSYADILVKFVKDL